jgi:hypothetical protein
VQGGNLLLLLLLLLLPLSLPPPCHRDLKTICAQKICRVAGEQKEQRLSKPGQLVPPGHITVNWP